MARCVTFFWPSSALGDADASATIQSVPKLLRPYVPRGEVACAEGVSAALLAQSASSLMPVGSVQGPRFWVIPRVSPPCIIMAISQHSFHGFVFVVTRDFEVMAGIRRGAFRPKNVLDLVDIVYGIHCFVLAAKRRACAWVTASKGVWLYRTVPVAHFDLAYCPLSIFR